MAVRAHAQQRHVDVAVGPQQLAQGVVVVAGGLLGVGRLALHAQDVRLRGQAGQQGLGHHAVVGVGMVRRDAALVPEDQHHLAPVKLRALPPQAVQVAGGGAPRHGQDEAAIGFDGLAAEDVQHLGAPFGERRGIGRHG